MRHIISHTKYITGTIWIPYGPYSIGHILCRSERPVLTSRRWQNSGHHIFLFHQHNAHGANELGILLILVVQHQRVPYD